MSMSIQIHKCNVKNVQTGNASQIPNFAILPTILIFMYHLYMRLLGKLIVT